MSLKSQTDQILNAGDASSDRFLVDASYVYAHNPDVAAAGLGATQWYETIGWKQGADPNAYFNTSYYLTQNPDVAAAGVDPLHHYLTNGWMEGRDPSVLFSTRGFLAANPTVAAAGVDPLVEFLDGGQAAGQQAVAATPHTMIPEDLLVDTAYVYAHNPDVAAAGLDATQWYETIGWKQGANPNAYFNTSYYLTQNPDVAAAGVDPLHHYLTNGWMEGRDPSVLFSTRGFLAANPTVAAAGVDPLVEFLDGGQAAGQQAVAATPHTLGPQDPLVDASYVYAHNPDVAAAGLDATQWYETIGWKQGANPNAYFNTSYYLTQNPDVAAAGVDPLHHYLTNGWMEGRDPSVLFSTRGFLAANPTVAAAGVDPLVEFLDGGQAAGQQAVAAAPHTLGPQDPLVDASYVYAHNPDVAAAGLDATQWYETIGWKQGANPNAYFNTSYYLTQNPDVAAAGVDPLHHYLTNGWMEGRDPSVLFSTRGFLAANPTVAAAGVDPLVEFLDGGQAAGQQAVAATPHTMIPEDLLVDTAYVYAHNPDVAAAGLDATQWYETIGWKQGANPNAYFNTSYYLTQNPDVAAAGVDPLHHYLTNGWMEGRDPSVLFSTRGFLAANPTVAAAGVDPLVEFLDGGQAAGQQAVAAAPHTLGPQDPLVDASYVYAHNPDVAAAGLDATQWYETIGWKQGANPNAYFNTSYYLTQNPDVAAAGVDPLHHYLTNGWMEGRDPSVLFSTRGFLAANPTVAAAGVDPLVEFLDGGQAAGQQAVAATPHTLGPQDPLVDASYVYAHNPDVAAAGLDATQWYETIGWKQGANPNAYFNTSYYLTQNPDVAAAGVDPLQQFETQGWQQGRDPGPAFSTTQYLAANPDVAAAGVDPLQHYLKSGSLEGRAIYSARPENYGGNTQTPLSTSSNTPIVATISYTSLNANGTITISGTGQPQSRVELAEKTQLGSTLLDSGVTDGTGAWTINLPAAALSSCSTTVEVRSVFSGTESAWSTGNTIDVPAPAASPAHVGADLSAKLAADAAAGADATKDIQALADEASGNSPVILDIPAGTYILNSSIQLRSNTTIDAPGVIFQSGANWTANYNYEQFYYSMFTNSDPYGAGNSNITIKDVTIDFSRYTTVDGFAIRLENVKNALVQGDTFIGVGDGTAFEDVDGAVIKGNTVYGSSDYAFDNWDGPKNTVILNNTAYVNHFGGVAITGSPTDTSVAADALGNAVIGNLIIGADTFGIDVESINDVSSVDGTFVYGNDVSGAGVGIQALGNTRNTLISSNLITGSLADSGLLVASENIADPTRITASNTSILNNVLDYISSPADKAALRVSANQIVVQRNEIGDLRSKLPIYIDASDINSQGNGVLPTTQLAVLASSLSGYASSEGSGVVVDLTQGNIGFYQSMSFITTIGTSISSLYETPGVGAPGVTSIIAGSDQTIVLNENDVLWANTSDTINLSSGNTVYMTSENSQSDMTITGGDHNELVVSSVGYDGKFTMSDNLQGFSVVRLLDTTPQQTMLNMNSQPGLLAIAAPNTPSTIIANGPDQTILVGLGKATLTGADAGGTTFQGRMTDFDAGDKVYNFTAGDKIYITDISLDPRSFFSTYAGPSNSTVVDVESIYGGAQIILAGAFQSSDFKHVASASGFVIEYK